MLYSPGGAYGSTVISKLITGYGVSNCASDTEERSTVKKGELIEIPLAGISSIPSPATYTVNVPPASSGSTVVDSSPFIPINRGLTLGAGPEDTKKPTDVAVSELTAIDRDGEGPARTKLRNGGSVSSRLE